MISHAIEDYMKVLYELQESGEPASNSTMAEWLGIAPASVTEMIKRMESLGLVDYEPYRGARLTPQGEKLALKLVRRHRLIELFLMEVLGIAWDRVHIEAHRLEHAVSEHVADRMAALLAEPKSDPHGRPIPSRSGRVDRRKFKKLSELHAGQTALVASVDDEDPKLLAYLGEIGLYPDARLVLLGQEPFGGSLRIRVGGNECSLGIEAAPHVRVTPL
jgi:DtxR family Mn-dependent transcriptional regulator